MVLPPQRQRDWRRLIRHSSRRSRAGWPPNRGSSKWSTAVVGDGEVSSNTAISALPRCRLWVCLLLDGSSPSSSPPSHRCRPPTPSPSTPSPSAHHHRRHTITRELVLARQLANLKPPVNPIALHHRPQAHNCRHGTTPVAQPLSLQARTEQLLVTEPTDTHADSRTPGVAVGGCCMVQGWGWVL